MGGLCAFGGYSGCEMCSDFRRFLENMQCAEHKRFKFIFIKDLVYNIPERISYRHRNRTVHDQYIQEYQRAYMDRFQAVARDAYTCFRSAGPCKLIT